MDSREAVSSASSLINSQYKDIANKEIVSPELLKQRESIAGMDSLTTSPYINRKNEITSTNPDLKRGLKAIPYSMPKGATRKVQPKEVTPYTMPNTATRKPEPVEVNPVNDVPNMEAFNEYAEKFSKKNIEKMSKVPGNTTGNYTQEKERNRDLIGPLPKETASTKLNGIFDADPNTQVTAVPKEVEKQIESKQISPELKQEVKKTIEEGNVEDVLKTIEKFDPKTANNPLEFANAYLGLDENNALHQNTIKSFLDAAVPGFAKKASDVTQDSRAWCAAFVNHVLSSMNQSTLDDGGDPYNIVRAKKYLDIGEKVDMGTGFFGGGDPDWNAARPGDIVVIKSRDGGGSHVAFYSGMKNGKALLLGGNQNDQVNVMEFNPEKSKLSGVRRLKNIKNLSKDALASIQNTKYYSGKGAKTK